MNAGPPPMPLFCPHCGQVLDDDDGLVARQTLEEKDAAIVAAAVELAKEKALVKRLREDQLEQATADPYHADALEVFRYWKRQLCPAAKEFSGERLKAVLARLHAGWTVPECKRAIDGARAKPMNGRKRTELLTIFRNERNLQMFLDFADLNLPPSEPEPEPSANGNGHTKIDTERLAALLAAKQMTELRELSMIGLPPMSDDQRSTVATSLRLAARSMIEQELEL